MKIDDKMLNKWALDMTFPPLKHVIPVLQRGNIVLLGLDGKMIGHDRDVDSFTFSVENIAFMTGSEAISDPMNIVVFARFTETGHVAAHYTVDGWICWGVN